MFRPTQKMSMAKARLMKKIDGNPLISSADSLSQAKLETLSGIKDLREWMAKPGFSEWFLNGDYIENLLEADLELGMERLQEMLSLPLDGERGNPKPGDITKAVELLLKYTGREPKKQTQVEYQDKEIGNMDEAGLDKIINKSLEAQKIQEDLKLVIGD